MYTILLLIIIIVIIIIIIIVINFIIFQMQAAGIHVMTVGVGGSEDVHELIAMTSQPHRQNSFKVSKFGSLHSIKDRIRHNACNSQWLDKKYVVINVIPAVMV